MKLNLGRVLGVVAVCVIFASASLAVAIPTFANVGVTIGGNEVDLGLPADFFNTEKGSYQSGVINVYNESKGLLAQITNFEIMFDCDPYVTVNFAVEAYANTSFYFSSTVFVSPTVTNGQAIASATANGLGDEYGGNLVGKFDGKAYQASYNSGTVFTKLVNGFAIPADNGNSSTGMLTGTISGAVSDITGTFWFDLTAGEMADGTSTFSIIVPEPATLAVLGLGALGLIRRK